MRCGPGATGLGLLAAFLGLLVAPARAQAQLIEPARAIERFDDVREALGSWDADLVPRDSGVPAAAVVLRGSGMILGRGESVRDDGLALRDALGRAMRDAERRLGVPRDAQFSDRMGQLGRGLALSLELAGPMRPFEPSRLSDASLEVSPGLEGVAARQGDRIDAVFPSTMLLVGGSPAGSLRSLVASLTGDAGRALLPVETLRDEDKIVFYRFEVRHLAQADAEAGAEFLTRGGRVVRVASITRDSMREMGDGVARYLVSQSRSAIVGSVMRGTYIPTTDQYEGEEATYGQAAVTAYALARYARTTWGDRAVAGSASGLADAIMLNLADAHRASAIARDPSIASLVLLARHGGAGESVRDPRLGVLEGDARTSLSAALERPDLVPPAIKGLVAHALTTMLGDDRERDARIEAFVRGSFADTPPPVLVAQMPWLGWAEMALSKDRDEVGAAVALRQMRDLVWTHQLQFADTGSEASDLVGGVVFTSSNTPLPTWQTIRPAAFLATMVGDDRLTTTTEAPGELASLVRTMRFIRQLAGDEWNGTMYPNPDRARWGIRSALWDQTMTPEASALALLCICEFIESLEGIGARDVGG